MFWLPRDPATDSLSPSPRKRARSRRAFDDAWLQERKLGQIAPVERKIRDLLFIDKV